MIVNDLLGPDRTASGLDLDCSPSVSDVGGGGDGEGWQVNKWWHLVILAKRIKSLKVFVLSLVVADVLL